MDEITEHGENLGESQHQSTLYQHLQAMQPQISYLRDVEGQISDFSISHFIFVTLAKAT